MQNTTKARKEYLGATNPKKVFRLIKFTNFSDYFSEKIILIAIKFLHFYRRLNMRILHDCPK